MRNILTLSALVIVALTTGCSTMTPEQQAAIPYKSYSPCGYMMNHPKCNGQGSQSIKEIEARKAYAAGVLEQEARKREVSRDTYRAGRDF